MDTCGLIPRVHTQVLPSRLLRLLREDFLTSGKPLIEFGAHFIEEITFDRIKHLAECRRLFESGHAHVIGACRIEGGHVRQDVGDRDDLCLGIDFAQVPDKLCIRRAFEQRVGHRADEDLGRRLRRHGASVSGWLMSP